MRRLPANASAIEQSASYPTRDCLLPTAYCLLPSLLPPSPSRQFPHVPDPDGAVVARGNQGLPVGSQAEGLHPSDVGLDRCLLPSGRMVEEAYHPMIGPQEQGLAVGAEFEARYEVPGPGEIEGGSTLPGGDIPYAELIIEQRRGHQQPAIA